MLSRRVGGYTAANVPSVLSNIMRPTQWQYRKITFEHQYAYDEWLTDKFKYGDILGYRNTNSIIGHTFPMVVLVLAVCDDLPSLIWNRVTGLPNYAKRSTIYTRMPVSYTQPQIYDCMQDNRFLSAEEMEMVKNHDELQANIKKHFPSFVPNYNRTIELVGATTCPNS